MAWWHKICKYSLPSLSGYVQHNNIHHKRPKPPKIRSEFHCHPDLNAHPCDQNGNFLPHSTPPPPCDNTHNWAPFNNGPTFRFAELHFEKIQTSKADIDELLRILVEKNQLDQAGEPIFQNCDHLQATINAIEHGETSWTSFQVKYTGPITPNSPSWKWEPLIVHTCDSLNVVHNMIANVEYKNSFDYVPYEEYTGPNCQCWSNIMLGRWAFKKANMIAEDPITHGSMLVPIILGADKTTVSVATGNQEFHPLYLLIGNVYNEMRHAHPSRESAETDKFCLFKKMTTPKIVACPDGHFRRAIFELGPFVTDYPEQVFLAGIVQGWCPKCQAPPDELEQEGRPHSRAHTEVLVKSFNLGELWDAFSVIGDVIPFTDYFPHADIHKLITPDLLHQLIKGTFKDHLVKWVKEYVYATADSECEAKKIMDDIDQRIAIVPAFLGLRRFPEGRNFKQWTGNDSKALMKVFLPAIVGYAHNTPCLEAMDTALTCFHEYCVIFQAVRLAVEFGRRGMFNAPPQPAVIGDDDHDEDDDGQNDEEDDAMEAEGQRNDSIVTLPKRPAYVHKVCILANQLGQPMLPKLI
ncbi:hypothetical protein JAAARDRAFT_195744 [Jaapia argillacea MUCL 33604]|uniref:CxC2-like cysteine cluster KDZ transposase-associated domain-containing protein n=1 Tax=Jaapia argillacea MUCL 33604 TaxID=933084 RepID=A0A067PNG6_9AGAM|nr:hypothetical protein JAAARDRAFT_195744 [Jaapia argillacea MUCL 33604]